MPTYELPLTRDVPPERFAPFDTKLEVQLVRRPNQTEGGVIIPDAAGWNTAIARVISTGPNVKQAKRGDMVLVPREIESRTIRFGGIETYTCEEAHLYGILKPAEAERVLAEQLKAQQPEQ